MSCFQYTLNQRIYFLLADITDLKVDVIVNFVRPDLSNPNRLNRAILDKGGNSVEMSLKQNWNQSMTSYFGTILTPGGDLPCNNIMHTTYFLYKPNSAGYFEAIIDKIDLCLNKAEEKNFKTLVFPIIYPENIERIYFQSLESVLSNFNKGLPYEIYFVCKDEGKFETLLERFKRDLQKCKSPMVLHKGQLASNPREHWTTTTNAASSERFVQGNHDVYPFPNNSLAMHSQLEATASAEQTSMDTTTYDSTDPNDSCPICLSDFTDRKTLEKCSHSFCTACIDTSFASLGPSCPICQTIYGEVIGQQPPGTMTVKQDRRSLPGYPNCGMYILHYDINRGIQQKNHPNPGKTFSGAWRTAYLPANNKGEIVLKMLQKAFKQKLIFTIGISRTTNQKDTVTWNDIHHKTSTDGGPFNFGYPDENYLNRVTSELEAKGIDAKSVAGEKIEYTLQSI